MFGKVCRIIKIFLAVVFIGARCLSQDDKIVTSTLSLQFVMDDYIPRTPIYRPSESSRLKFGKPAIANESLQVDLTTLGIRNIVAAVRIPTSAKLPQFRSDDKVDRRKSVDLHNSSASPRVIVMRSGDEMVLTGSTSFSIKTFKERDSDSTDHALFRSKNGEVVLDCSSLETGFHPLDCTTAPWITFCILVWPNDFSCVSNEHGHIQITGLPANTDLELVLFHERAKGRRISELNIGGRLQMEKPGVFTFRLAPGTNDLGQVKVKGQEFHD